MKKGEIASTDDWSTGWYCLRSKPRMENVAAASLSSLEDVSFPPSNTTAKPKNQAACKATFSGIFFR